MSESERRGRQETEGEGSIYPPRLPPPVPPSLEEGNERYYRRSYGYVPLGDELSQRDYEEIRGAMGHGAPTLLLGTSARALDRNLQLIRTVRAGNDEPPLALHLGREHSPIEWKLTLAFNWIVVLPLVGALFGIVVSLPAAQPQSGIAIGLAIAAFLTVVGLSVPPIRRAFVRRLNGDTTWTSSEPSIPTPRSEDERGQRRLPEPRRGPGPSGAPTRGTRGRSSNKRK